MDGYIKSKKTSWVHIFKMSVRPGGTIPLADLYNLYGKRYNIAEKDFVTWLKDVKLKGSIDDWLIIEETLTDTLKEIPNVSEEKEKSLTVPINKMTIHDLMDLPVRKAREVIPGIMDIKLLKFALRELKPLPNKESICRIIDKRIMELSINPH
jgi:hypothetical protein